jgi:alpha-amylase/alpha-mannosidase (GH57 family)
MSTGSQKNIHIIIHGHFYQPPRENPWTGAIEPQESAAPYHDWNERITAECYTPNSRSRILDHRGRVNSVVNNYRHMSFNFGPTLLSYLSENHPMTYQRILEADKVSVRERGHGNAIAQAYNHVILPLASPSDRWTQIMWGLHDFRTRFGRPTTALWLPETACNDGTLVDLVRAGMRFVIVAPSQAQSISFIDSGNWVDVSNGTIPVHQPYLYRTPVGTIAVLFYHAGLSRGVAFEHLLRNAGVFADRILEAAHEGPTTAGDRVVLACTDGESYGHHEPMGDMCLAYLASRELVSRGFTLTNPSVYLEEHPPTWEVRFKPGQDGLGTAWSCAHGVGRWREDCGCSTGGAAGWNQGWRAPLRRAFDRLRERLDLIFEREGEKLFDDPWLARDQYIEVILGGEHSKKEFFARHARHALSVDEQARALQLLEMQRHGMLMYTSCGWFFSDPSGIETLQNLKYAERAAQFAAAIAGSPQDREYRRELGLARSNIQALGTGVNLVTRFVLPSALLPNKIAAHFAILTVLDPRTSERPLYHFQVTMENSRTARLGKLLGFAATVHIAVERTGESGVFDVVVVTGLNLQLRAFVRTARSSHSPPNLDRLLRAIHKDGFTDACRIFQKGYDDCFGLADMLWELRQQAASALLRPLLDEIGSVYEDIFNRNEESF